MINTQQLIVMMPLFKIEMPANAEMFFTGMMQIAAFDVYEFGDIIHELMMIDPTDPINENYEKLGFQSQYFLVNMGTILVFVLTYILSLIVSPIISLFSYGRCSCKWMKKITKRLNNKIFWGSLIVLMNESYMIVIVCVLINIRVLSMDSAGLKVMSILCVFFLFLTVILPSIFLMTLYKDFKNLESKAMQRKYGVLYQDLKLKNGKKILMLPGFFLFRRVMLAISVVFAGEYLFY